MRLVAGRVELPVGVELPRLAGQPRQHARLDSGEVGADEMLPGSSAQRRARDRAYDLQRIAPARQCIAITGDHGVDQRGGQLAVVAGEVLQLPGANRTPAPGSGAVDAQCITNAVIDRVGDLQQLLVLARRGCRRRAGAGSAARARSLPVGRRGRPRPSASRANRDPGRRHSPPHESSAPDRHS